MPVDGVLFILEFCWTDGNRMGEEGEAVVEEDEVVVALYIVSLSIERRSTA